MKFLSKLCIIGFGVFFFMEGIQLTGMEDVVAGIALTCLGVFQFGS